MHGLQAEGKIDEDDNLTRAINDLRFWLQG